MGRTTTTKDSYDQLNALDFRQQAMSSALNDDLQASEDIDTFLEKNRQNMIPHNLPKHLSLLLKQKGLRRSKVARDSLLDRKYVYQIFSG